MTLRSKSVTITTISVLVAIFAALFVAPVPSSVPYSDSVWNRVPLKLGLDLRGGAHLVYQADMSQIPPNERSDAIAGVRDVIERRINALGVSEPVVQTNRSVNGDYRVIVEMAGVFDVSEAKAQIGETPLLEFKEEDITSPKPDTNESEELSEINSALFEKAKRLLEEAKSVEDFAEFAKENSDDPGSAQNGGDLGFVSPGVFVPEFDKVLFDESFEVGTIWPELVESPFGWHIIKKTGERDGDSGKEVQSSHVLIRREVPVSNSAPEWKNTQLTGKQLKKAELLFDPNTGSPQVGLTFDNEGKDLFRDITARNIGKPVAIFLDGEPISIPVVQQRITGGQAVISGQFTIQEAKLLAQRLNAGALPVPIELISQQTVGSTLGQEAVNASVKAGAWGLILVVLFMILYYRLPGIMAVISLAIYALVLMSLFQMLGVTLTLAGIAGFILSLGLAVDANVLIFERMKEELRKGRTLSESIEIGFTRAWTAIRDSNISSLLTALILYWFGTSLIRGFAITLGLGITISMLTAIIVTRSLIRLFPNVKSLWLFGVSKKDIRKN